MDVKRGRRNEMYMPQEWRTVHDTRSGPRGAARPSTPFAPSDKLWQEQDLRPDEETNCRGICPTSFPVTEGEPHWPPNFDRFAITSPEVQPDVDGIKAVRLIWRHCLPVERRRITRRPKLPSVVTAAQQEWAYWWWVATKEPTMVQELDTVLKFGDPPRASRGLRFNIN